MNTIGGFKVVLLACLGMFVCMLDSTIMNITLPAIQEHLNTSLETSSWMLNIYTMTIAVFAIPFARFAEMFGKHKFFILGLLVFGIGSALCGFAYSGEFLIMARFIQSLGASILIPCSMVIGIAAMPLEKRVLSLTLLGATQGLATALGPSVGGLITEKLSWHWVFYVNVPICIIAIFVSFLILNLKTENRIKSKIDWLGLLFSTLTIFSMNLVLIKGNSWGWGSSLAYLCYLIFASSLVLFIIVEKKVENPMVNLVLFKDRIFTGSVLIVSLGFIFLIGVMVLLPQFLTIFQNKTELEAALLITPSSAAIFIFANFAGFIVRKIGFTIPIFLGFAIMGIAYFLLHNLNIHSTSKEIMLICALLGLGFSFVISSATIASTSSFEGELLTASQSVFSMIRQVGVVLAVAIFIAGLTNNIDHKKQNILNHAKQTLNTLDLPKETQEIMLKKTKTALNKPTTKTNNNEDELITEAKRKELIEGNFQKAMANIPAKKRSVMEKAVLQQVEKQVDEEIATKTKEVKDYTNSISTYSKNKISSSFGELYKKSLPFVFFCCFAGLIFIERRREVVAEITPEKAANN